MSEVAHPKHYNLHPSGIEAIDLCEIASFNVGNAWKYLFRAGLKPDTTAEIDRQKARFYLEREFGRQRAMSLREARVKDWEINLSSDSWNAFAAMVDQVVEAEPNSALGVVLNAYVTAIRQSFGGFETVILHMRNALDAWETRQKGDQSEGERQESEVQQRDDAEEQAT